MTVPERSRKRVLHTALLLLVLVIGQHTTAAASATLSGAAVHRREAVSSLLQQLDVLVANEQGKSLDGTSGAVPPHVRQQIEEEMRELAPDVDELFAPGFHAHLTGAFVDMFHAQLGKARRRQTQLDNFDIDSLLQVDSTLSESDRGVLKTGITNIEGHLHQVGDILAGEPKITKVPQHHRTPQETLAFLIRAHHLEHHLKVEKLPQRHDLFQVTDSAASKPLFLRRTHHGGWEWSPKAATTCWAFVKTAEPPCWFHSRAKTHAPYIKLVDALKAHQSLPIHVTEDQKPSTGETIEALGFGFVNGLFMGMGDLFRNAFRHTDCDGVGPAVKAASHQFKHAFAVSGRCVKDVLSLKKDSTHCDRQAQEWKLLITRLKHLFSLCKTLQRTVGVIIAVVLVALVAVKVITTLIGSAAGPIGAFVGAAVGVIVKIGMIVLAAATGLHFMAKTVRKFLQARRRCHHGPCIKRDIVAMIESGMEFIGVWVGVIALSGLDKVIDMPKFRNLFRGQRPRFQPKFLRELENLKLAYHNAKNGRKVAVTAIADDAAKVSDDVVKQTDDAADDIAKREADEAAKQAARDKADEAALLESQRKAEKAAAERARLQAKEAAEEKARLAQKAADEKAAARRASEKARQDAAAAARAEREAAEVAKRAQHVSDDAVRASTKEIDDIATEIERTRQLEATWKPDGTYSLHRKRIRGDHFGRTELTKQYTPQHNPYTAKLYRLQKQMEMAKQNNRQAQQVASQLDEAATVAKQTQKRAPSGGYNFGTKQRPTDRFGVPEYMRQKKQPAFQYGRRTTGGVKTVSKAAETVSKAAKLPPAKQAEFQQLVKVMENARKDYIGFVKNPNMHRTSHAFRGIDVKIGNLADMHKAAPQTLSSTDDALRVFNDARNALMKFEKSNGIEVFYQARLDQLMKAGDAKAIAEYKAFHGLSLH